MAVTWQSVPFGDVQNKADEICFASRDKNFMKATPSKEEKLPKRNTKTPNGFSYSRETPGWLQDIFCGKRDWHVLKKLRFV